MRLHHVFQLAIGAPWARRLGKILECTERHAFDVARGKYSLRRRRLLMLERYLQQKRGARSSRLEREYAAARRRVAAEDAALDTLLAWCESELAKKK